MKNKKEISKIIDYAVANGSKTYFTGVACLRGHVSERVVSTRTCLECSREDMASDEYRNRRYKTQYGVGLDVVNKTKNIQNNKCAICNNTFHNDDGRIGYGINIDHCHATGEFRGLLCGACNKGIGLLNDDVSLLKSAIEYLTNSPYKKLNLKISKNNRLIND